jgi:hypothetical protein
MKSLERVCMLLTLALALAPMCAVFCADRAVGPLWAGPGMSGSWYDPARSGEGIVLEYLPDGTAAVVWFTYPAVGQSGDQAWVVAAGGTVQGDTIHFTDAYQPQGTSFGDAFDPKNVQRTPWGSFDLQWHDCNSLTVNYTGPAGYGSGHREYVRLTSLDQINCSADDKMLTAYGARALAGMSARSGPWYVPSRSGEGWLIEELSNGLDAVFWFTFDPQGHQAWTLGVGNRTGNTLVIDDNVITKGTNFGDAFDPKSVQRIRWGSLTLTFSDCNTVDVTYQSTLPGYGSATRHATHLSALAGAACIDGTPVTKTHGAWTEHTPMPSPAQSELDVALWDNQIYALGGFGEERGFKRYDPASDSWAVLPQLPGGRNHLAAFAFQNAIYYSGGDPSTGGGDESISGWRYDLTAGTWSPVTPLGWNFGSRAAVLNGRAYIGDASGMIQEYDPRQNAVRVINPLDGTSRDHSQLVAYLGEIWVIAGRTETIDSRSVAIYDPISETWRTGPSINGLRGGFAAAVVDDQIVIGGGEIVETFPVTLNPTSEVYTAGNDAWVYGPNLPIPVHGTAGAAINGEFYLVSGSVVGGSMHGATGRLFSIRLNP